MSRAWGDGAELDLDHECRRLTLRVLSRSVLGVDLDARADALVEPLLTAAIYITNRAVRPVRAPWWLPTPARRRARAASATFHRLADDILQACRADPTRDATLVRALIDVADPETGQTLSDDDIRHELVVFLGAGYDTTATTLTYALWALGRHPELQDRVAAEVAALGDRPLTSDDVPRLGYTVQVLHEALRLCPPAAGTSRMVMKDFDVDGYRVEAGTLVMVGIYAMHRDPVFGTIRWCSTPTDSARQTPRTGIAGNSCRLVAGRGPALAITSPCSKRLSVWRPSSGTPKFNRSTMTFPSPCPSPWSPAPRSRPAPGAEGD